MISAGLYCGLNVIMADDESIGFYFVIILENSKE